MAIKIPVSAQFDAADLQQQIKMVNDQIRILASQVGNANKQKWEPINLKSKEDLQGFIKQMDLLMKKQSEFAQKMKQTGQGKANPLFADFKKMSGGSLSEQIKLMESVLGWAGVEFSNMPAPKPPRTPPNPPNPPNNPPNHRPPPNSPSWWQGGWGQHGMGVVNAGLSAAGPLGGVVKNALSSGMAGGAGAGLMGLVGGLAALGVGKIIGAIADKIGEAQDNAIGLDKLYRQVYGVASYGALKAGITGQGGVADLLGMKSSEAIGMASAYSRANLRPGENLATGLLVSGGMARTLGMDPTQLAGGMGALRGANIGRSDQETRRLGMLIGEAIGRSGSFGQAGEAFEAIKNFATTQARASLTNPNIAGYGGALSGLMATGLPGMDAAGAASLLSRVNAALMRGGNMGEASQAFTARMGLRNGMTAFDLRQFQEGGMFGTMSSAFGEGSPYARAFGRTRSGNTTYFDMVKKQMASQYGAGSQGYYLALANHLGTGLGEAETLSNMSSAQLGGADARAKRLRLNVTPQLMAQMGVIEGGGSALGSMAKEYLGRSDLSSDEQKKLLSAYKGSDPEALKDIMMQVVSAHGGTKTEGSEIRDNIAKLDNTMTRYADQALPALNMMRMALVKMAGGGDEASLRQEYADNEKKMGKRRIDKRFDNANRELQMQLNLITGNDEEANAKRKAIIDKQHANDRQREIEIAAMNKRVDDITGIGGTGNTTAEARLGMDTTGLGDSPAALAEQALASGSVRVSSDMRTRAAGMEKDIQDAAKRYGVPVSLLRGLVATESGFRNGLTSRAGAIGPAQIVPKWNRKYMQEHDINTQRGNIMIGAAHLADDLAAAGGDTVEALRRYNGGTGDGRYTEENRQYAGKVLAYQQSLIEPGTMPASGGTTVKVAGAVDVNLKDTAGNTTQTAQAPLTGTFVQPSSFGNR